MPKVKSTFYILLVLIAICILPSKAYAYKQETVLSESWIVVAKPGKTAELAFAISEHATFRKSLKDPKSWQVYTPVLGDNLNAFVIRSCCTDWAGMDEHEQWDMASKASEHWNKTAGSLVGKYIHNFDKWDMSVSNWPDNTEHKFVGLTTYRVKIGHWRDMKADMKLMSEAAKAQKWPYRWAWGHSIAGEGELKLAIAYTNFAAMEPPEKSFSSMLAEHMGSEEKAAELIKRWLSHFDHIEYNIYRLRLDIIK